MRIALTCLAVAAVFVSLPALADEAPGSGNGSTAAPSNSHTLAQVHGGLTADSARVAGQSREVEMSATKASATKVARPAPTPRVLRKMSPERVVNAVDPALRACAPLNTTTAPLSFGVRLSVAPGGEVEDSELASTARVPAPLLACVVRAVSTAHFGAPGAAGASIVLPITVPGRASPAPAADTTAVTVTPPASAPVAMAAKPADPTAAP